MKILLLGYGFLGRFLHKVLTKDYKVKVLSNNIPDSPERGFYLRDFANLEVDDEIFNQVDMVIHTIHTTVPATSMLNLKGDIANNVFPTIRLLEIMGQLHIQKLIYISSGGAIYGNPITERIDESQPTNPMSGYGISKLAIEKYIQLFNKTNGIEYVILRPSNLFGPNQNLHKPQGIVGHLLNALKNDDDIDIWGNGDGKKDYLYVGDLVRYIEASLIHFNTIKNECYNVASGFHYSVNYIIEIIESKAQKKLKKHHSTSKGFDVQDVVLDGTKFQKLLTIQQLKNIESFIADQL